MRFFQDVVTKLQQQKGTMFVLGWLMFCLVAVGDYVTTKDVNSSLFHLVPVAIFVWFIGRGWAWVFALASSLVWPSEHVVRGDFGYFRLFIPFWEMAVRIGFSGALIASLSTIKRYLDQLKVVNTDLSSALAEVRQLKGLLPICSECKKIRDDSKRWGPMEQYIQSHTDAQFSHGVCPECAQKLYAEYYRRISKKG